MFPLIPCGDTDNKPFIEEVNKVVTEKISALHPKELFITYINNWFDAKWLHFSGTVMHEVAVWNSMDVVVPPFHPNRVIDSKKFCREAENYTPVDDHTSLHIIQTSSANLRRKLHEISNNGLFVWYSSNTNTNDQGSVLIYFVNSDACVTCYFGFEKNVEQGWNVKTLLEG